MSVPNVTRLSNPPASISAPKDPHAILRTIRQIWNEILNDDCVDLAASMAYFFVLALFPCFVVLGALAGFLPYSNLWTQVSDAIIEHFPFDGFQINHATAASLSPPALSRHYANQRNDDQLRRTTKIV